MRQKGKRTTAAENARESESESKNGEGERESERKGEGGWGQREGPRATIAIAIIGIITRLYSGKHHAA
jgi:hypothetical protein